jgi:putative tryptophan/tyrosine transport system substrate-binding protein
MRRRDFITLLGGTAAAWPLAAGGQQPAMPVIGFLHSASAESYSHALAAFRRGLSEAGYVEGQNVAVEHHWAQVRYDQLPTLAADLVRRQVAVIVAGGGPAARAARGATATIPIIFYVGTDPVAAGLVASMNRPEGNATGVTMLAHEMDAKRLELLRELLPAATAIAVLLNLGSPNYERLWKSVKARAIKFGQKPIVVNVRTENDLDTAFASLVQVHADGLVVSDDPLLTSAHEQLVALAARHKIPTIYPWRENIERGGLISYGPSHTDGYRQVGIYTGLVLKGKRPSDLPVLQPTKFETVLNLKTAKTLGIDVPTSILFRADDVIE